MTFALTIKTAGDIAADAVAAQLLAASAECRRRIEAVADATAQLNLASASAAGLLSAEQLDVYRAGLGWVAAMRAAWRPIAEAEADLTDDANWPAVPTGVAELAADF